ncbi:uncharacterized protein LOC120126966 [Hibiscus syriacus]|uniref:uncharacterized protein LOC120126966 n=1 Tax=Hibiscus syriacus TaxID=106335 RepID=UPI00192422FE|nr:uncharacterized protein LOC120126966 [Hibiscus syriacus]
MYYVFKCTPDQIPLEFQMLCSDDNNKEGIGQSRFCFLCCGVFSCTMFSNAHLTRSRSSNNILTWPFLVLSRFGGAYALLPYFVLWSPPSPVLQGKQIYSHHDPGFYTTKVYNNMTARKGYNNGF